MKLMEWTLIIGIGAMAFAVYTAGIGLRGLITKRPLVFAYRQYMWFMLAVFAPTIILLFILFFEDIKHISFFSVGMSIFSIVMTALTFFILWRQMSGYVIFGVSDDTFREALTNALDKLNLPYQETVSKIKLTSVDADLQATVASWMGTAQIRIKQWQHVRYAKDIANAMDDYYKNNGVKVNNIAFVIYLIFGGLMVVSVIFLVFAGFLFGL
jgi:hypothetical protein